MAATDTSSQFVTGDKVIDRILARLPDYVGNKILTAVAGAAAGKLVQSVRREVPAVTTPGHSRRSMTRRIGKSKARVTKKQGFAKVGVGVGLPRMKKGDSGGWTNVVAAGSKERKQKSGRRTGRVLRNRFVPRGARKGMSIARRAARKKGIAMWRRETAKLRRRGVAV